MTSAAKSPYAGYRFPGEVISHAVWLYFRFPLSLRMVEDLLAARGIIVSHQTVRLWAEKFGRAFASEIRRPARRVSLETSVGVDGPLTASLCQNEVVADLNQEPSMDQIIRIGMDTSKHVFQLHGVNAAEEPVLRKKLRRQDLVTFFGSSRPPWLPSRPVADRTIGRACCSR